jgi:hypothetical protein
MRSDRLIRHRPAPNWLFSSRGSRSAGEKDLDPAAGTSKAPNVPPSLRSGSLFVKGGHERVDAQGGEIA